MLKKLVLFFASFLIFGVIGAHAQCANTGFVDGCSGAPSGSPQFPHRLDTQKVTQLNIIGGSGYTNGTYTWTTSGGGGSGATGTVTVTGGVIGGTTSQGYTISNEGSGYTSRPTIAVPAGAGGGSGGSITPTVYAARPAWNVAGVDYYVGVPTGTVLKDPTGGGNLPSGATLSGSTVNVTGCNVTLNGFDFTLHNNVVVVNTTGSNCATVIENSKFQGNATSLQTIANCTTLGTGGSLTLLQDTYNGLAATGGTGSGFEINDPVQCAGTVTFEYNDFENFDSKISQLSGLSGNPAFTEKYNLFANFGYCSTPPCSHGEAEYMYSGAPNGMKVDFSYNSYFVSFTNSGHNNLTSPHAIQADDVNITGTTDDHNVVLSPGPQGTCNAGNANAYTSAGAIYNGDQEGGTLSGTVFTFDYIDNSGTYFPWYNNNISLPVGPNNIDAGSAAGCGNTTTPTLPTVPTAFRTTSVTTSVALAWTASTAGSNALSGYHIYRNGSLLASTASTTYTDSTVSSGTYYYTAAAYDSAGNIGAQSGFVSATISGSSPAASFSPTSVTFAGTTVNATNSQVVTLMNTGTATLTVSTVTISGSGFFTESDNCAASSPIAINGTCTITAIFEPTALGTVTGSINVTDNAPGSPQSVPLSGTATSSSPPVLPVLAGSLPAGTVGASYGPSGLTASGGTPPYVTWTVNPTLPAGLSLNLASGVITGTPTAASTTTETFTVTDSAAATSNPYSTSLVINSATTTSKYTMSISPTSFNFTAAGSLAITVDDTTPSSLPITFTTDQPWLTVCLLRKGGVQGCGTNGTVGSSATQATGTVAVTTTNLAAGSYTGHVTITAGVESGNVTVNNSPITATVTLTVAAPPSPSIKQDCTNGTGAVTCVNSLTSIPTGSAYTSTFTADGVTVTTTGKTP